jgi:CheY-like chemotaxis protein
MTKILVSEDDIFGSKVYKLKLEKQGFEVIILANGLEVVAKAIELKPDIIVLDILMPLKDGFEALKELKLNAQTKDIPVLILSALQMDKDIQKGKELGASDYLPKTNVTMEQVIAKIVQLTASPASPVE